MRPSSASFLLNMKRNPIIVTNLAFHQSQTWCNAVTTICREHESPDNLNPFVQAFRLLKGRTLSDAVVTMGPRPSLIYGLLCLLLRLPSKQILTEIFLDETRPESLSWRLKTSLFRQVARHSLGILTNSSAEVNYLSKRFNLPEAKLHFVPMHTTVATPEPPSKDRDGSVLSIGRSLRDLETLIAAAPRFGAPLTLIVGQQDSVPTPLSESVQVFREVPLADVHQQIRHARVVVIPLRPTHRSTGQVVLFEAMALGTPVVATRTTGIVDYVRDGENGLLVEPNDVHALSEAVQRVLKDPELAERLSRNAQADCLSFLSAETYSRRLLKAIRTLASP